MACYTDNGRMVCRIRFIDFYTGVALDVAVGRAAVHVTLDLTAIDGDMRLANIGQIGQLCPRWDRRTQTAAIHIAVVAAIRTNLASVDNHLGSTCTRSVTDNAIVV